MYVYLQGAWRHVYPSGAAEEDQQTTSANIGPKKPDELDELEHSMDYAR